MKIHEKILLNPRIFFLLFYIVQRENVTDRATFKSLKALFKYNSIRQALVLLVCCLRPRDWPYEIKGKFRARKFFLYFYDMTKHFCHFLQPIFLNMKPTLFIFIFINRVRLTQVYLVSSRSGVSSI